MAIGLIMKSNLTLALVTFCILKRDGGNNDARKLKFQMKEHT